MNGVLVKDWGKRMHECWREPLMKKEFKLMVMRTNSLLHGIMCIPANKQHGKVHCSHRKNKMKKTIPIGNVIFQVCFSFPELWVIKLKPIGEWKNNKEYSGEISEMDLKAFGVYPCWKCSNHYSEDTNNKALAKDWKLLECIEKQFKFKLK